MYKDILQVHSTHMLIMYNDTHILIMYNDTHILIMYNAWMNELVSQLLGWPL